jgi:hypothetical protein
MSESPAGARLNFAMRGDVRASPSEFSWGSCGLPARADQSALNLAAARLRYIAGTAWSTKRYLNIELLKDQQMRDAITA